MSRNSRSSTAADGDSNPCDVERRRFVPGGDGAVERPDGGRRDRRQPPRQLLAADVEVASASSSSVGARPCLASSSEIAALDVAGPAADRPRHPVELAQPVVDGTADAGRGERLELHASVGLEPLDGVDQAEHPGADQIAGIDARRQAGADTAGDELHERRVVDDQVIARRRCSCGAASVSQCIARSGSSGTMLMLEGGPRDRRHGAGRG